MLLTGPSGARIEGRYPRPLVGRTMMRRDVDRWLLGEAIDAGAEFEENVVACRVMAEHRPNERHDPRVTGVIVRSKTRGEVPLTARVVIAADGRRSALASSLGLMAAIVRPRRWAVGAYFEGVAGASPMGQMHIRTREYLGVAPLPGGLTNACLVASIEKLQGMSGPEQLLRAAIRREPSLHDRFARARMVAPPVVLGPLAVDVRTAGAPGLLLAGDAAGFIDPITGDGLRFALRGAELAAETALEMLARGNPNGHAVLAERRRTAFAWKWRLNRTLRRIVDSPAAIWAAERGASLAPVLVESLVAVAGDCAACGLEPRAQSPEPGA
jgi:flavin-dependent dehydrogenase